jgi:hypothetical protein
VTCDTLHARHTSHVTYFLSPRYWINVCAGEEGKKSRLQWQVRTRPRRNFYFEYLTSAQDIEFKDMKNLMINVLYFVKLFKGVLLLARVCRILQVCKIFQVFAKMDTDNDGRIKLHDFTQVMM